ncbi:hypothetical protein LZ31DRAFT_99441 [Colletotrichum somersetense]|nr:hypothetical protein LZ31DRAFT_99441 [Colletotrichum somersetense]
MWCLWTLCPSKNFSSGLLKDGWEDFRRGPKSRLRAISASYLTGASIIANRRHQIRLRANQCHAYFNSKTFQSGCLHAAFQLRDLD